MVRWRDNTHIMVAWSNRAQNRTIVTLCHVVSTDCQEVSKQVRLTLQAKRSVEMSIDYCNAIKILYIYKASDVPCRLAAKTSAGGCILILSA